jgi:hypothetical protein
MVAIAIGELQMKVAKLQGGRDGTAIIKHTKVECLSGTFYTFIFDHL